MKLTIQRDQKQETFTLLATKATTLLAALYEIKSKLDSTLTFGAGCRSGVCGSCAVLVNGKEQLACSYKYNEGDCIAPLRYHPHLRDLKVDKHKAHTTLQTILSPSATGSIASFSSLQTPRDEAKTRVQTDCILCDSCYSACPVFAVNSDFLGPFSLTRAWRYIAGGEIHKSEEQTRGPAPTILENIQKDGIWDCTLCGECTIACPQGIDPKTDILMLRGEAGKAGYINPNFGTNSFDTPDFGVPDFNIKL